MGEEESPWNRQKREITSYNTFYSTITGRAADNSFSDKDYILVNVFPSIPDTRQGLEVQPDFLLYNGSRLIMVEIKSGTNIEDRHVDQMQNFSNLTIEAAESYIKETETVRRSPFEGNVNEIIPIISYEGLDEEYIEKCRHDWPDCKEKLEALENEAPILTQSRDEELKLTAGTFESDDMQRWFERGIQIPKNPKKEIFLTEGMELESLAVAVSSIWGQRATDEKVEISVTDVRSHFDQRAIEPGRVRKVFHFLDTIGACGLQEKNVPIAEFSEENMSVVLNIEQTVAEKPVDEWME